MTIYREDLLTDEYENTIVMSKPATTTNREEEDDLIYPYPQVTTKTPIPTALAITPPR